MEVLVRKNLIFGYFGAGFGTLREALSMQLKKSSMLGT